MGGLIQFNARGAQDFHFIGNPQISFFKIVYRRYTNFSMETIKLEPNITNINDDSETNIKIEIKRHADMVSNMYFTFELPNIYSHIPQTTGTCPYEFKWIENIGSNIIDSTELIIGGSKIVKHTGKFLNVLSELRLEESQKKTYHELIGHVPEINDPKINTKKEIFIPVITGVGAGISNTATNIYEFDVTNISNIINGGTFDAVKVLNTSASSDNDFYNGKFIKIINGNTSTTHTITDYTGVSKTIIISPDETTPGLKYIIYTSKINSYYLDGNNITETPHTISYHLSPPLFKDNYDNLTTSNSSKTINLNAAIPELKTDLVKNHYILIKNDIHKITANTDTTITIDNNFSETLTTQTINYRIVPSISFTMKVRINIDSNSKLSGIEIIEINGDGLRDGMEFKINIGTTSPTFKIMKSNYPHCRDNVAIQDALANNQLFKNVSHITKGDLQNYIPSIQSRKIKVPLQFFCNVNSGLALPLIALQYHEVEVKLTLKKIYDLFTIVQKQILTDNVGGDYFRNKFMRVKTNVNDVPITNFIKDDTFNINSSFEANYIYLDTDERKRFAENNHEYLITECSPTKKLNSVTISQLHNLDFYHPVKEIIIVPQRNDMENINNWNNYTNWPKENMNPSSYEYLENERHYYNKQDSKFVFYNKHNYDDTSLARSGFNNVNRNFEEKYFRKNIINNISFKFNNTFRQREQNSIYYNKLQAYQHYKTNPKDGIYVYSFSLNPNEYQPSGCCNFSNIENFQMEINLGEEDATNFKIPDKPDESFEYNISIYAINYNILRFASGMASKQYAN